MEKKSKFRILGILIVSSLVVIALPFFQSEKEQSTEVTLVKAPPFPDSSISPDQENIETNYMEQLAVDQPNPEPITSQAQGMVEINTASDSSSVANPVQKTDMTHAAATPIFNAEDIISHETKTANDITSEISKVVKEKQSINTVSTSTNKKKISVRQEPSKKIVAIKKLKAPIIENNGLAYFKGSVWVIQLGSFKNKSDALRLTNRLRSSGYRAFIQQVSTSFGNSTRVFVGPEYQQNSAFALAQRLAKDLHIRGVVVSYKPLTL